MRKIQGMVIAVVLAFASVAAAAPAVGDLVKLRIANSQFVLAVVGRVVSGTTVDLVAFTDGTTWQDTGTPSNFATLPYYSVTPGTSVGQYQTTTIIADIIAAAGYATQSYADSAAAAATAGLATETYVDAAGAGYLALPPAPSSGGMTLGGSGVQLSATRPVLLTVRGTATMVSTLGAGQAFTVELRCDANATPTTVVDDQAGSYTDALGVVTTSVVPWKLVTMARAGDRCRVVQSAGTATLALTGSSAQAL